MKFGQIITIVVLSVLVTSLGVAASDSLKGNSGSLLGLLIGSKAPLCPKGMVEVSHSTTFSCVDEYEASAGTQCPNNNPNSALQTTENLSTESCIAQSSTAQPWVYINRAEATLACARAGKRLPTASEWYEFALGTDARNCNVSSQGAVGGDLYPSCVSALGIKQTIGNVWEWTSDDVFDDTYNSRTLPGSGFVDSVDSGGVATSLRADASKDTYLNGYLWSGGIGSFGILRGGFYNSKEDAGIYTVQAQIASNFSGVGIGFRCVK